MVAQFSTPDDQIKFAATQIQITEKFRDDLLFGDGDFQPILGFDKDIDNLPLNEKCQPNTSSGDLHNYYVCYSANQLLTFFKKCTLKSHLHSVTINALTCFTYFVCIFSLCLIQLI